MDRKNKFNWLVLSLFSLVNFAGCQYDQNNLNQKQINKNINAYVVTESITWNQHQKIEKKNTLECDLIFLNNPYDFEEKRNNVIIHLNNVIIYEGKYNKKVKVNIPLQIFDQRVLPTLQIFRGNTEYHFIQKMSIFLSKKDKFFYVVFCPDNDLTTSCYLFAQEAEIL